MNAKAFGLTAEVISRMEDLSLIRYQVRESIVETVDLLTCIQTRSPTTFGLDKNRGGDTLMTLNLPYYRISDKGPRWRAEVCRAWEHWNRRRGNFSEKLMKLLLLVLAVSIASRHAILLAQAQSLAEVAGEERQRREHLRSAGRVYTNADLNKYQDQSESSSGQGRESKPSVTPDTPRKPESEEEFVWSQRFMGAKRRLLDVQTQSKRLQAKLRQENVRAILLSPADGFGYGPYGTSDIEDQLKRNNKDIASAEQELEDLREQLRKSGKPVSWESSLLALRSSSGGEESATPGFKDSRYWQGQLALIDEYYSSLIDPLEAQMKGDGEPGNTYPDDIKLLVQELNQKREEEKAALAKQAFREGALPGWFR